MRLQAKVRLIEAIRDALGEAEAYVGGKCAVECVRDALRNEAEHLDEVGWHTRARHFFDAAEALDALNKDDAQSAGQAFAPPNSSRTMLTE